MDQSAEIPPNPKVDAIIANITQLMNEAEQMLCDSTSNHAEHQVALLRTQYDDLQAHFAALCESAGRTFTASARQTDRLIRDHPYRSLAVALGAGWLLGVAFTRSRW